MAIHSPEQGQTSMPARHHRTVDRTVAILELAARSTDGVSLAELASTLEAPKSSIQELTNGLMATGYLTERLGRLLLGPGAFVLSLQTARLPLRQVSHEELERAQSRVGLTLFVGARVGEDHVFVDQAGEDVLMDFVSATHPRRPLLETATGKVILAYLNSSERNDLLGRLQRDQPELVASFLQQLPEIRESRLAYNEGGTLPNRNAVATPLIDPRGNFLAAICAVGGDSLSGHLADIGATLLAAVDDWRFSPALAR
jgi:DNA-binding IclR family transcriptional regulator